MVTVDVVLVGYRSERYLPRLREDLAAWSYYPNVVHFFDNLGNPRTLSRLWNELADQGKGDYIAIMNPDIALCRNWDFKLAQVLEENPNILMTSPDPFGSSPTADPMPTREQMLKISEERASSKELTINDGKFYLGFVKRETWEFLKGVDERMRFYLQDSDFMERIKRLGRTFCIVHSCPVWHRGSDSTAKAIERGEIDQKTEYDFCFSVWREVREHRWKDWDLLTDQERAAVREDPRFRMGVKTL